MKLIYSCICCEIKKRINFTNIFFSSLRPIFLYNLNQVFNNHYYLTQNYPLVLDMLWTYLVLFFPDLAKFFQILIFSNFFYLLLLFHYKPDPWCIFLGKKYINKSIMYILTPKVKTYFKTDTNTDFQFFPYQYQYLNFEIPIILDFQHS